MLFNIQRYIRTWMYRRDFDARYGKPSNEASINRLTGWLLAIAVIALLAVTAQPVAAPVSCEGKVLCLFITE